MPAATLPRWSLRAPSERAVKEFLAPLVTAGERGETMEAGVEDAAGFSYPEVGASRDDSAHLTGYNLDHNREQLSDGGEADFEAACEALRAWRMFPAPWTRISPERAPIRVGQVVAMQAHAVGFWWLSACRIVYQLDDYLSCSGCDDAVVRRFGFAYGTLPAHVEQGEERFSVELHLDGSVWYDLRAFSRPRYWPVRLAKPLARRLQMRFVRESKAAMRAAVRRGGKAVLA